MKNWLTNNEKDNDLDWTHKKIKIIDIRKLQELYILKVEGDSIDPILINQYILDERLKSYFLQNINWISREQILSLKWNMYISKGEFFKIKDKKLVPEKKDPDKFYISFLEIEGPLGSFDSIVSKK